MFQRNEHEEVPSLDYSVLQMLNDSTLLLVTPDGKERKTNSSDAKPCSTSK